jgi:hypothetical protein
MVTHPQVLGNAIAGEVVVVGEDVKIRQWAISSSVSARRNRNKKLSSSM